MLSLVLVVLLTSNSPVIEAVVNEAQLKGIQNLVKGNFSRGIYATCRIILFEEKVDFETADSNCKHFDVVMANRCFDKTVWLPTKTRYFIRQKQLVYLQCQAFKTCNMHSIV
eukprot:sb/3477076/